MLEYGHLPRWRSLAAITVTAALLIIGAYFFLAPVKVKIAERYVMRGDTYFTELQFSDAEREYSRARTLDPQNTSAVQNGDLAKLSEHDLKAGLPFFNVHHVSSVVQRLAESLQAYPTPKEALAEGVKLYTTGQFAYARYPLERATQLDPAYPEAWNYLAKTYQELGKSDPQMQERAKDASMKRDSLTVKYILPLH